jgi:hypothetical protein
MRNYHAAFVFLLPMSSLAAPPSELLCVEQSVLQVEPATLVARKLKGKMLYMFKSGRLLIKPEAADEYDYGPVTEPEPGRFVSGHKTFYLEPVAGTKAWARVTHVYKDEVRISIASCWRP